MLEVNQRKSIVAYYLSKYNMDACAALGYHAFSEAFKSISIQMQSDNAYIKRRRDEFDVLTGSHRKGQRLRKPTKGVLLMHEALKNFSFDQLTQLVKDVLEESPKFQLENAVAVSDLGDLSEEECEAAFNQLDQSARRVVRERRVFDRIFDKRIPDRLKELYNNRCQICGQSTIDEYGVNIVEAHHIIPFASSANNDASNIIVLCPNHHRIVHQAEPVFDRQELRFVYPNGRKEQLVLNIHLDL